MKKPLARFTPPGKAVREKKVPPREGRILKNRWLMRKNGRNRGNGLRWLEKRTGRGGQSYGRKCGINLSFPYGWTGSF